MGEIETLAESFLSNSPKSENVDTERAKEYVRHLYYAAMMHFFMEKGQDFIFAENGAEKMIRQIRMVDEIQRYMKDAMEKNNFKPH